MGKKRRAEPPILQWLEEEFERTRKKAISPFPYDAKTKTIILPYEIESELRHLVVTGRKVEAVKRVTQLTGAGLRVSKDYVDSLTKGR
jgi:ribosomal protein L7/L12